MYLKSAVSSYIKCPGVFEFCNSVWPLSRTHVPKPVAFTYGSFDDNPKGHPSERVSSFIIHRDIKEQKRTSLVAGTHKNEPLYKDAQPVVLITDAIIFRESIPL